MVKTCFTQAAKSISRRSMSLAHAARRLVIHRGRLSVLVAVLIAAVCLAACVSSSPGDPPSPSGTQPTDPYISPSESPADPYPSPYETPTDPATYDMPTDQSVTDPYAPSGETNHCAYAGDPLCPDTPITVPSPDIGNWP